MPNLVSQSKVSLTEISDEKKLWQLLTGTMNTLKPSDKALSVKAASDSASKSL